jgi:methylglyoxal synthase
VADKSRIAIIAHDEKKDDMVAFVAANVAFFASHDLVSTGTTGQRIIDACPQLSIQRLKSGPPEQIQEKWKPVFRPDLRLTKELGRFRDRENALGGDQQIGALIAEGKVGALIFFVDPLTPMPHDVDVKALMRLAIVYDIPMALNRATAELLVKDFGGGRGPTGA